MAEFLDYIKRIHFKLCPPPVKVKFGRKLQNDSIDEITDLEDDGILTTSTHLLSLNERERLKQCLKEMR